MFFRLRFLITQTLPIWLVIGFYFLISLFFISEIQIESEPAKRAGPVLFWQNGVIYTINPDGSDLTRVSQALLADQRITEVSPGCQGVVSQPCMILIGHVLYHLSGNGVPLPLTPQTEWINGPASWSPNGTHLAYIVSDKESGVRRLMVYDTAQELVWQADDEIDEAIKPAWSQGCIEPDSADCFLAYGKKSVSGQQGRNIGILNWTSNAHHLQIIPSGRGHLLKWAKNNRLYYGGELGWFDIETGNQFYSQRNAGASASLSPRLENIAYVGPIESREGVWLNDETKSIYISPEFSEGTAYNHPAFWSPRGEALATINQGKLIYYSFEQDLAEVWYDAVTMDVLLGYAFSPTGMAMALVEGQYVDNPEKPQNRLIIVHQSGEVIILRTKTEQPIILLSWLPENYKQFQQPTYFNTVS